MITRRSFLGLIGAATIAKPLAALLPAPLPLVDAASFGNRFIGTGVVKGWGIHALVDDGTYVNNYYGIERTK